MKNSQLGGFGLSQLNAEKEERERARERKNPISNLRTIRQKRIWLPVTRIHKVPSRGATRSIARPPIRSAGSAAAARCPLGHVRTSSQSIAGAIGPCRDDCFPLHLFTGELFSVHQHTHKHTHAASRVPLARGAHNRQCNLPQWEDKQRAANEMHGRAYSGE